MLENKSNEKDIVTNAFSSFSLFLKYNLVSTIIWTVMFTTIMLLYNSVLITLGQDIYARIILVLTLPIMIMACAILTNFSPLIFHSTKYLIKKIRKKKVNLWDELSIVIKEQKEPTYMFYKIKRVIQWALYILSNIAILLAIIYVAIMLLINS